MASETETVRGEADFLNLCVQESQVSTCMREPIAIIGMACRLPGANNTDELWNLILNKVDAIGNVPVTRWLPEHGCASMRVGKGRDVEGGFLKYPIDEFDGKFFGLSPAELEFIDPQQRLMLEVSWEALENGFIPPDTLQNTDTAIFIGNAYQEYRDLMMEAGAGNGNWFRHFLGNGHGGSAGRLSFFYGTTGPSIATESGCSSSMVAVGLALKALRAGETSMALACTANLLLYPYVYADMSPFISARCKTFDASADGFGRAEGVVTLVLKRLSEAVSHGDRILAIIRGYGQTSEGLSKSAGTPTLEGESLAIRKALQDGGISPAEVSYVEIHGTGTPIGDPLEMEAIANVYAAGRSHPLMVGSIKANIGHTEASSGMAAIVKTILALWHKKIPPQRFLNSLNPKIQLDKIPGVIPLQPEAWECPPGCKRIAGVTSIGLVGTNCHAILEEAPLQAVSSDPTAQTAPPFQILTFSSKSEPALRSLLLAYEDYFTKLKTIDIIFSHIAYTAAVGRTHFGQHRLAIIANSIDQLLQKLRQPKLASCPAIQETPKIIFLFTGHGSQYPGMGQQLYNCFPTFRFHFDNCDEILQTSYNVFIKQLLWGKETASSSNVEFDQISLFVIEYSLGKLWEAWGIVPDCVLGHSLGEIAAAHFAGILSLADALRILITRSKLIATLPPGSMLVLRANKLKTNQMLSACNSDLEIAAVNSPDQTVLAGSHSQVESFMKYVGKLGIKCTRFSSTHAFHSRHMDPILDQFARATQYIQILPRNSKNCQFISALDGRELEFGTEEAAMSSYWTRQIRGTVNFMDASRAALQGTSFAVFLEVGPQPILSALVNANYENSASKNQVRFLSSLKKGQNEVETILSALGTLYTLGFKINWKSFYEPYKLSKVDIPFYQFQRKKHWFKLPSKLPLKSHAIDGEESFHHLLGTRIVNTLKTSVFQTALSLTNPSLKYLSDHALGTTCILPAAAFLEMALAASNITTASNAFTNSTKVSLTLQNLTLEKFVSVESRISHMQVVLSKSSDCSNVEIYKKEGEGWIRTASVTMHQNIEQEAQTFEKCYEKAKLLRNVVEKVEGSTEFNYTEELKHLGYCYGPAFQSLVKFWRPNSTCSVEKVWETKISEATDQTYNLHPICGDAMIQALLFGRHATLIGTTFCIPVSVKRVVIRVNRSRSGRNFNQKLFIHTFLARNLEPMAVLYAGKQFNEPIAIMEGVSFIPTTLAKIKQATSQEPTLPHIMGNTWIKESEFKEMTFITDFITAPNMVCLDNFVNEKLPNNSLEETATEIEAMTWLDKAVGLHVLHAFIKLGFDPNPRSTISIEEIFNQCRISTKQNLFTNWLLRILEQDGHMQRIPSETSSELLTARFEILKPFPSTTQILRELEELNTIVGNHFMIEMNLLNACSSILPEVLQGNKSAIPILFPSKDNMSESTPSAQKLYENSSLMDRGSQLLGIVLDFVLKERINSKTTNTRKLRILEVGAGTGSATRRIVPYLNASNIPYCYHYTDVSPSFFSAAEIEFQKKNFSYRVFNLEEDPLSQGYIPEKYDIIVASMVLHATRNLSETLNHLRSLTKPNGLLLLFEGIKNSRLFDLTFGLLDGYWRYEDSFLRKEHCLIDYKKWHQVLYASGYTSTHHIKIPGGTSAVILSEASQTLELWRKFVDSKKLTTPTWIVCAPENRSTLVTRTLELFTKFGRHVIIADEVAISDAQLCKEWLTSLNVKMEGILYLWGLRDTWDQSKISKTFLNLVQALIGSALVQNSQYPRKEYPRIVVVTEGATDADPSRMGSFPAATLWGMSRTLRLEQPLLQVRCVDVDPDEPDYEKSRQVFEECWYPAREAQIAYRHGKRLLLRLKNIKNQLVQAWKPLDLPQGERFCLSQNLSNSRGIDNLRFRPIQRHSSDLQEDEVEVSVKAYGLNFKDVVRLLTTDGQFQDQERLIIGMDVAGVVSRKGLMCSNQIAVGNAIITVNMSAALSTHIQVKEEHIIALPSDMTFAEGATLPIVFATAFHCIVEVGALQKGETILLHSAAGGVGHAAIKICNEIGATIIATAGSKRKRAYLKSIGILDVFNSRNPSFGDKILKATNGNGVNFVLNSLTGPGFKEASLMACSQSARFIEIGKLNIWSPEDVLKRRTDVKYSVVDLSHHLTNWKRLLGNLSDWISLSKFQPLPYVRFDAAHIRQALMYLQQASHIGKVVVTMPEVGETGISQGLFNDRSTYLITGGLGGIGLQLANWMIKKGAKHLVLVGRRDASKATQDFIKKLNNSNSYVEIFKGDVGQVEDCRRILEQIRKDSIKWPPLRGIMHAACIFSNAKFEATAWDEYEKTFGAKISGAWNLHCATSNSEQKYRLEHFVMFSTFVAQFGGISQGNYAAENAYLDGLALWRSSKGLPATTINWGPWDQIGVAAHFESPVFRRLPPTNCFATLEFLLQTNTTQAIVFDANISELSKAMSPAGQSYLKNLKINTAEGTTIAQNENTTRNLGTPSYEDFWAIVDSKPDYEQQETIIEEEICKVIISILKHDENEIIDRCQSFADVGLDSLMIFEFKNYVQNSVGDEVEISLASISGNDSVQALAKFILENRSKCVPNI